MRARAAASASAVSVPPSEQNNRVRNATTAAIDPAGRAALDAAAAPLPATAPVPPPGSSGLIAAVQQQQAMSSAAASIPAGAAPREQVAAASAAAASGAEAPPASSMIQRLCIFIGFGFNYIGRIVAPSEPALVPLETLVERDLKYDPPESVKRVLKSSGVASGIVKSIAQRYKSYGEQYVQVTQNLLRSMLGYRLAYARNGGAGDLMLNIFTNRVIEDTLIYLVTLRMKEVAKSIFATAVTGMGGSVNNSSVEEPQGFFGVRARTVAVPPHIADMLNAIIDLNPEKARELLLVRGIAAGARASTMPTLEEREVAGNEGVTVDILSRMFGLTLRPENLRVPGSAYAEVHAFIQGFLPAIRKMEQIISARGGFLARLGNVPVSRGNIEMIAIAGPLANARAANAKAANVKDPFYTLIDRIAGANNARRNNVAMTAAPAANVRNNKSVIETVAAAPEALGEAAAAATAAATAAAANAATAAANAAAALMGLAGAGAAENLNNHAVSLEPPAKRGRFGNQTASPSAMEGGRRRSSQKKKSKKSKKTKNTRKQRKGSCKR